MITAVFEQWPQKIFAFLVSQQWDEIAEYKQFNVKKVVEVLS